MIDKQVLKSFREDFAEAVKDLESKYGLVIELGSIKYSATSFEVKMSCKEGESKDEVNAQDFKLYCRSYGLEPDDYDRRFTFRGEDYIIVGIRPSKRTYPIVCQKVSSGQTYGFTPDTVKNCLK